MGLIYFYAHNINSKGNFNEKFKTILNNDNITANRSLPKIKIDYVKLLNSIKKFSDKLLGLPIETLII